MPAIRRVKQSAKALAAAKPTLPNCVNVDRFWIATPVGKYELEACPRGLHSLNHTAPTLTQIEEAPSECVRIVRGDADHVMARQAVTWLSAYFLGKPAPLPHICHLDSQRDSFRVRVWRALYTVGWGERVSYTRLAELAGAPGAARALGSAMRANRLSLLVPCHRVVRADGAVGAYSGGSKDALKHWLLKHEAQKIATK